MATPSRRVVDITTRRPLGLSIPADEPRDDIEVDDGPIDTTAEEAELLRYRETSKTNRQAWLSDIDTLLMRAQKHERRFTFAVVGEVIGEMGNDLRKEFGRAAETPDAQASLRKDVEELKLAHGKLVNENQAC
jgi:hypothetical protein